LDAHFFGDGAARRIMISVSLATALLWCAGHSSCSHHERPSGAYTDVLIKDVPHIHQKSDFCGEACAEMYLRKLGKIIKQDYVFDESRVDPLEGRGCRTAELAAALKKIGFKVGDVWYKIPADNAAEEMEKQFAALYHDLAEGVPSIVCMHYALLEPAEHFRLVLGYDSKSDELIYHEPAEANGAYRRIKRKLFFELWPLKYDEKTWTLIRLRLEPGEIVQPPPSNGFTDADYAQHIMKLKEIIPDGNFTVVLQKPFVVIGDEEPRVVRERAARTVRWAVDKLKQDFFEKDPEQIIDIWLFKNEASYRKYSLEIFGDYPTTPFGYFSHRHNALIMNVDTGGGTLVHEIVHPFIASNFPRCPAWFNEGLASLYEQSCEHNGHIWGLTNWRLAGLQEIIRAGKLPSFKQLTGTTDSQFYSQNEGDNYAQARYLCYYLQQKGLLVKFYHQFRANYDRDPTGFQTLKQVLGKEDMASFQKEWEAFVLQLRFP